MLVLKHAWNALISQLLQKLFKPVSFEQQILVSTATEPRAQCNYIQMTPSHHLQLYSWHLMYVNLCYNHAGE